RHGRGTIGGVAAPDADAVVLVAPHRSRPTDTIAEVLRQPVRLRPDFSHLAAHGENIAAAQRPPMLPSEAGAIEGLAPVERDACAHAEINQVPLPRVVLGVDVAPQPLPGTDQRGNFKVLVAVDLGAIMGGHERPLRLVLDPTVPGALALLTSLPSQTIALIVHAFDVRMVVQHAETVLITTEGGRQMHVEERTLPVPVHAQTGPESG